MPDVRFGIDAQPALDGAVDFARALRDLVRDARAAQEEFERIRTGGAASPQAIQAAQQQAKATEEQVKATQNLAAAQRVQAQTSSVVSRAARQEEAARLAQIRQGIAFLRVINDEQASYARRVDAAIRYARALGIEIDTKKLLLGVQNQLIRARADSVKATTVEEIASRNLRNNMRSQSESLKELSKDFKGLSALLRVLPGNLQTTAIQASNLTKGFATLGPVLGTLVTAGTLLAVFTVKSEAAEKAISAFKETLSDLPSKFGAAVTSGRFFANLLDNITGNLLGGETSIDVATRERFQRVAAAFATLREQLDPVYAGMLRLSRIKAELAEAADTLGISQDYLNKLYAEAEDQILGLSDAEEKRAKTLQRLREEEEKRRAAIESAVVAEADRLDDLRFQNELLENEIEAAKQGAEALRQWQIEKAAQIELRRQERLYQEKGIELSKEESDALLEAARRNADLQRDLQDLKKPKQAVGDYAEIWERAIENIQSGFGDLFTNVIANGKDAFNNFGSFLKQMFARVAGEIANVLVFRPLFSGLQGAVGAGGAAAGGSSSSLALGGLLTSSVSSGFTDALKKLGLTIGGAVGSSNAVAFGQAFPAVLKSTGIGTLLGGFGADLLGGKGLKGIGGTLATGGLGLGGGILGGLLGGPVGAAIGGAAGGFLGNSLGSIVDLFKGDKKFNAAAASPGLASAAVLGGLFGPLGFLPGAAIALLLGAIFGKTPRQRIGVATSESFAGLPSPEGGIPSFRETPFGFINVPGAATTGNMRETIESALNLVQSLDRTLSANLKRSERDLIKASGLPLLSANEKDTLDKLAGQRIGSVLSALGIPSGTLGTLGLTQKPAQDQIESAVELLAQRAEIVGFLDQLRGTAEELTDAERALEEVEAMLEAVAFAAPSFGLIVEDLEELRQLARSRIVEGFDNAIRTSILSITDPSAVAADALAKQQEQRLREVEAIGADIVEAERLNLLERQNLLKQLNDPIQSLVDAINVSPSGSSPTLALSKAESRFFEIAGGLQAKTGAFTTQDLSAAAQSFLGLGEQFLGGPTFAAQRENVLSVLESFLLSDLPGTTNTQGQLQSLTLETARGNAITEQLLQELVDSNEAQASEIAQLREQLERLLAR